MFAIIYSRFFIGFKFIFLFIFNLFTFIHPPLTIWREKKNIFFCLYPIYIEIYIELPTDMPFRVLPVVKSTQMEFNYCFSLDKSNIYMNMFVTDKRHDVFWDVRHLSDTLYIISYVNLFSHQLSYFLFFFIFSYIPYYSTYIHKPHSYNYFIFFSHFCLFFCYFSFINILRFGFLSWFYFFLFIYLLLFFYFVSCSLFNKQTRNFFSRMILFFYFYNWSRSTGLLNFFFILFGRHLLLFFIFYLFIFFHFFFFSFV